MLAKPAHDGDRDAVADHLECVGFAGGQVIAVVQSHQACGFTREYRPQARAPIFRDQQQLLGGAAGGRAQAGEGLAASQAAWF